MQMCQLTRDNFDSIKDHPIYLAAYSEYYLGELCDEYDILNNICGGFDGLPHRQGMKHFRGHDIEIRGYDALPTLTNGAVILIAESYIRERFEQLRNNTAVNQKLKKVYYYADKEFLIEQKYREHYQTTPLKNIILFRGGNPSSTYVKGEDLSDNVRALLEYMLEENLDVKYQLVCLVNYPKDYTDRYKGHNVSFMAYTGATSNNKIERDAYYEVLCLASYIFATHTMIFARNARKDQTRVQLWHGCGFKLNHIAEAMRDENKYEYMTVTSKMYARLHAKDMGLRDNQILVTGLPKEDFLFRPMQDWKERFNIPHAKIYVFWLPTWRESHFAGQPTETTLNIATGLPIFSTFKSLDELNKKLCNINTVLIIKPHPMQKDLNISCDKFTNILMLHNNALANQCVFINELLGYADALISDYSSVAVDYMLLDRPIAFTLDDCAEYTVSRGFHWSNIRQWLPGEELFTTEDFFRFITDVYNGKDNSQAKRHALMPYFHSFADGNNSQRVLNALGIKG